ncbi:MAG: hypothetical protein KBI07_05180 [Candidatus Atribacteria bacterium]|nr:hypothetical protein [Candidatus Atribacteria bacterium]
MSRDFVCQFFEVDQGRPGDGSLVNFSLREQRRVEVFYIIEKDVITTVTVENNLPIYQLPN